MRRSVLLLVLTVAAVLAPQAGGASPKVAALQVALFQHGYYDGGFDGVAGPVTRAATKRFQRRHHLVPDGIAGRKTRVALGRWGRHELGQRQLRRGSRGWDVAELQFLLRRNGISLSLDGIFGAATAPAVIGSQRAARRAPDAGAGGGPRAGLRGRRGRLSRFSIHAGVRAEIDRWSRHYGVDGHLACALAWMESGDQPNLTSAAGAWGVFQITPGTWEF